MSSSREQDPSQKSRSKPYSLTALFLRLPATQQDALRRVLFVARGGTWDKRYMKLSRTPVYIDLDRPRRIIFNMAIRKQLEELENSGTLKIGEIFFEREGKRMMAWTRAMQFVAVGLSQDAEDHGEPFPPQIERYIESVPQALGIVSQVLAEYNLFLGCEPGEDTPVPAKSADAGGKIGRAKKPSGLSVAPTESTPANSGD